MKTYMWRLYNSLLQVWRRRRLGIKDAGVRVGSRVQVSHPHLLNIGNGARLRDNVRITGKVTIGEKSDVRPYVFLNAQDGSITVGSNCSINDYTTLLGSGVISIGNDVRIAAHTVIVAGDHIFSDPDMPIRLQGVLPKPVVIEDDVWIAANVCILGGVRIGKGSVIGAGAVVTRSISPMSIAVGNPARVIRTRAKGELEAEAVLAAIVV